MEATSAVQGVALASRLLPRRDLAAGRLVQVLPDVLDGDDDFYLPALASAGRHASVDVVRRWLVAKGEGSSGSARARG